MIDIPDARLQNEYQEFLNKVLDISKVTVYRQFLPRRNAIEITVYFHAHGEKWRLDFEEEVDVLVLLDEKAKEWYLIGRMVELIGQGKHRAAANAVR